MVMRMHYRVNAGYIPLSHWTHDLAQGGGRIIGEGCHFIDFLTYLIGALPISVQAHPLLEGGKVRQDDITLTFRYAAGGSRWTEDTTFQVRLVGLERDWRTTALPEARYTELSPGRYRFEVLAHFTPDWPSGP